MHFMLWWRKTYRSVSSLAEPLSYNVPPASYLSSTLGSTIVKRLALYGLAPNTRKGYPAAISSYVSFCALYNKEPWPASTTMLEEWAATRIYRTTLPKQGQVKPDMVLSYLSALKSYQIDKSLSLKGIDDPQMAPFIKGWRSLFPSKKQNRLPITKDILEKITEDEPVSATVLNVDTSFKVAWAGFMRMRELTYTAAEAKKATFAETSLTRLDISFAERDQYAILRLKRSKTDTEHTRVQIILSATDERTCPVAVLQAYSYKTHAQPTLPSSGFNLQHSPAKALSTS